MKYLIFILIKIIINSEYPIEHYLIDESMQLYDSIKDIVNCAICLDMARNLEGRNHFGLGGQNSFQN